MRVISLVAVFLFLPVGPVALAATQGGEGSKGPAVLVVPGEGPPSIAVRLPVGSLDDPAGLEGVAALTARSLSAGSEVRRGPGELAGALGAVAGAAWSAVTPDSTLVVLEDVSEAGPALDLVVEMLALPSFPDVAVFAERARLARELAESSDAGAQRRAAAVTLASGRPAATAWSVHGASRDDVIDFHARHYTVAGATVALTGSWASDLEARERLGAEATRAFASWTARQRGTRRESSAARAPAAGEGETTLLLRGGEPGVAVAFRLPEGTSAAAALVALHLAAPRDAHVLGPAETPAGDLVASSGSALVVDVATPRFTRAARRTLRGVERLARTAPSKPRVMAVRHRLAAALDGAGPAATAESAGAREALEAVDSAAVAKAAAALARTDGTGEARVAVVATAPRDSEARRWSVEFPAAGELPLDVPIDGDERRALAVGAADWERAREAHRAAALGALSGFTWIAEKTAISDVGSARIAVERIDASTKAPPRLRYEARRGPGPAGRLVAYLAPDEGVRLSIMGRAAIGPVELLAWERRRHRLLPYLLANDALRARRVGGEADVPTLELLDLDVGLTRVEVDADSHRIRRLEYANRLPDDVEREVTLELSEHRPVSASGLEGAGPVLPYRQERSTSGLELAIRAVDEVVEWRLHGEAFDPFAVDTDPDEIAREMP